MEEKSTNNLTIVTTEHYEEISAYVRRYKGLAVDCEAALLKNTRYEHYAPNTISTICTLLCNNNVCKYARYNDRKVQCFYDSIRTELLNGTNTKLLLNFAVAQNVNPVRVARGVLLNIYSKKQLSEILRYPFMLPNDNLAANVEYCLCNDILDGPLTDMRRRLLGEEYELKLKQHCDALKLCYQDEVQLRNLGFDKTPDIRLLVPVLYRNKLVNWIESKAAFGDNYSHKKYTKIQLNSYCNRFGPGMVIYWFGYTEDTPLMQINEVGIVVVNDFPIRDELELLTMA